jgi:hypothetical protein
LLTHLCLGLLAFHQYPIYIPLLHHSCYMPCPTHPPWLDHSNYTCKRVQVFEVHTVLECVHNFSSCYN